MTQNMDGISGIKENSIKYPSRIMREKISPHMYSFFTLISCVYFHMSIHFIL